MKQFEDFELCDEWKRVFWSSKIKFKGIVLVTRNANRDLKFYKQSRFRMNSNTSAWISIENQKKKNKIFFLTGFELQLKIWNNTYQKFKNVYRRLMTKLARTYCLKVWYTKHCSHCLNSFGANLRFKQDAKRQKLIQKLFNYTINSGCQFSWISSLRRKNSYVAN